MSKTEFDKRKDLELWIYCNCCKRSTSHKVLTGVDYSDSVETDNEYVFSFWDGSDVVQCGGCKGITFTKRATDSESNYPGQKKEVRQFPPKEENASSSVRDNIYELPFLLRKIYMETLQAIANKSFTLAGIGLRAIIETLCKDKKVSGRNLKKKIDNLVDEGFLTAKGAEVLHVIRLLGNDAAHETKAPRVAQIKAALKVVDHLILGVYIIPEEAAKALPKRKKKAAKKKAAKKKSSKKTTKKKKVAKKTK